MRRERKADVVFVAIIVSIILMGVIYQAQAHTAAEMDEWHETWIAQADLSLSPGLVAEFDDMQARHGWYWAPAGSGRTSFTGNVEQWRGLVAEYFPADQVDRALCIIYHETIPHGNPNSLNPTSGASGLFQHLPKYWAERSAKAGWLGAAIMDPAPNVAVAAWLWEVAGGWSHWTPYQRGLCR